MSGFQVGALGDDVTPLLTIPVMAEEMMVAGSVHRSSTFAMLTVMKVNKHNSVTENDQSDTPLKN